MADDEGDGPIPEAVEERLQEAGLVLDEAERLAAEWVVTGDFLLRLTDALLSVGRTRRWAPTYSR